MPLVVKTGYLNTKDENGNYIRNNTIAEKTTQEQVAELNEVGTNNINAIEQKGIETLESIPDDYTELEERVDGIEETVYFNTETNISISASPDDWKLDGTGKCTQDSSYKLVKYEVAPGDTLHLKLSKDSDGVYQWQNAASVPSSLPNNNLVGTPVTTAIDGNVTVPTGATYLIVSQLKTNSTNSVKLVTVDETVKEKIDSLEEAVVYKQQGLDNVGKALVVGSDGNVITGEAGIPSAVKSALLACFEKVAWSDNKGQTYYDALYAALYNGNHRVNIPLESNSLNESASIGTAYTACKKDVANRMRSINPVAVEVGDRFVTSADNVPTGETVSMYILYFDVNMEYTGVHSTSWEGDEYTIEQNYPYVGVVVAVKPTVEYMQNVSNITLTLIKGTPS